MVHMNIATQGASKPLSINKYKLAPEAMLSDMKVICSQDMTINSHRECAVWCQLQKCNGFSVDTDGCTICTPGDDTNPTQPPPSLRMYLAGMNFKNAGFLLWHQLSQSFGIYINTFIPKTVTI